MKKAVIVIPTYNEVDNIGPLVEEIEKKIFPHIKDYKMEIVIVDDNSPDGTADVAESLAKKFKNVHVLKGEKEGLGKAYVRGMTYAVEKLDADVLFEMDADGQHEPKNIPDFLKKIDEGYDIVLSTRLSDGGSIPKNWPIQRKAFSVGGNLIVRTVLGRFQLHDWTGGYRAFKKEVFLKNKSHMGSYKGYTFQVAFLHKSLQQGFTAAEIPIDFKDRKLGDSKLAAKEFIFDLLKYLSVERTIEILRSPFPKYGLTGLIGYLINAASLEIFTRAGLHPGAAAFIGAELSIIWNFTVNNLWAFKGQKIEGPKALLYKFLQFNLVSAGSLVIITTVVSIGTHAFGNTSLVRQLSLIFAIGFLVVPYSYSMYNIFIWKRWHIRQIAWLQKMF